MQWIKCSDRLPDDWNGKAVRQITTKNCIAYPNVFMIHIKNSNVYDATLETLEWLDETAGPEQAVSISDEEAARQYQQSDDFDGTFTDTFIAGCQKVRQEQAAREELMKDLTEFIKEVAKIRTEFSRSALTSDWWLVLGNDRVAIEDILIMYDQMQERLTKYNQTK